STSGNSGMGYRPFLLCCARLVACPPESEVAGGNVPLVRGSRPTGRLTDSARSTGRASFPPQGCALCRLSLDPGKYAAQILDDWVVGVAASLPLQPQGLQTSLVGTVGVSLQVVTNVQGSLWTYRYGLDSVLEDGAVRLFPAHNG